ncbi:MAG: LysM peptidoglycan-binding domain-containing protein [Chitinophagales bacterium]
MVKLIFSLVVGSLLLMPFDGFSQTMKWKGSGTKERAADLHVVVKGETVYSISKAYQITVEELLHLNPEIIDNNLPIGAKIKVPVMNDEPIIPSNEIRNGHAILYTVQKKETLYAISKKYNTKVDTLLRWNNLMSPDIEEGSQLIVGYEITSFQLDGPLHVQEKDVKGTITDSIATVSNDTVAIPINDAAFFPDALSVKGIATWVKSGDDGGDFFALHPTAPKGTEVKVKNMMNGKMVTVKVIGKLPATSANDNVMIKISGSAANKLGVLDDRFLAALYYEGMNDKNVEESSIESK